MIEPLVTIQLDSTRQTYHPGDILSGQCRLGSIEAEEIEAVELSVLWYTEGKGDEDLSVHLLSWKPTRAPAGAHEAQSFDELLRADHGSPRWTRISAGRRPPHGATLPCVDAG